MTQPPLGKDSPLVANSAIHELILGLSHHFIRANAPELDGAIEQALAILGRYVGVSSCYLFEFDDALQSASKAYEWCDDAVPPTQDHFLGVTTKTMASLFPMAVAGQVFRFNSLADLPPSAQDEKEKLESLSIEAFLTVPIRSHGKVIGLVGFDQHDVPRQWSDSNELLLQLSADLFSQVLDRRRTHSRLAFHIDNAPLGVVEWDSQWKVQRWSPMAEQMFGWSVEEVLGQAWVEWRFVHEDDSEYVTQITEKLQKGIENSNVVVNRNYTKDGRVMTCEWFNSVLHDRSGQVVSFLSFVQDITERERIARELNESRAELQKINAQLEERVAQRAAELYESENRYRQLAEHATDMLSRHDEEGRFTYLSPACRRLLGYEPEELVGQLPRVIAHPDDREAVIQSLVRLRSTTEVVSTTFRALRKDGQTIWLEASSRNDGGAIVVVSRDVTGRLETEQRLRLIQSGVEQVGEAVAITDSLIQRPGPHIVYVNPAFTRMTGYEMEEVMGKSPRILQGPKTDRAVIGRMREALEQGIPFTGESYNYRKDGSEYAVEWNLTPLRDGQGRITHWVAIQRDVSARKTSQALARIHREELAHVTRLSTMGEMASGLAHELNQPLTAISNYMSGTLKRLENESIDKQSLILALQRAGDQAERAGQIIRRLRGFVSKRGTLRASEQINKLVHETLALIEADVQERHARIELNLAEALPPIHVDGIQIEQVLLNLIRNGLEAMDANPADDRVLKIATQLDRAGQIYVGIEDRGAGLTESQRNHLFDPFFTTKDDGMGMGLTISQSITQAHGGRLWVTANPQRGSTLHLTLPATEHK